MANQSGRAGRTPSVLHHRSLPQSVYEVLRHRILNNDIPAGAPLLEVALAEEFGVSRTTIRSAMRELQADRLIEIEPRRGTTVIRMSESDALEVCFARYTLEAVALREMSKATRRAVAVEMDEVVQVMQLCVAKADVAGMVEADTELHRVIVEACEHPLIVDMWAGLNGQMGALMRSSIDRQGIDLQESVRRHAELTTSFRDAPRTAVDAALREHYIRTDLPTNGRVHG